jgi:hypothetical protein
VYLALTHREAYVVKRQHTGKTLGDAVHPQKIVHGDNPS